MLLGLSSHRGSWRSVSELTTKCSPHHLHRHGLICCGSTVTGLCGAVAGVIHAGEGGEDLLACELGCVGASLCLLYPGLVDALLHVGHVLHPVKVEELLLSSVPVH